MIGGDRLALLIGVAAAAFALSVALVWALRALAVRHNLLDLPNARSSHARPTPRLGGVGILGAVVTTVAAAMLFDDSLGGVLAGVLGLASAVSLVSLADDLRGLSPLARLLVHLAAATLAVAWLGPLAGASAAGSVAAAVAAVATVVWITGFVNAFNFMDGIDGIAAAQALVAAAAWAATGWWLHEPALTVLAVAIAAASAGFLVYNWPPASIFMGDVGSALLGFLLAVLPLLAGTPRPVLAVLLPVWPFVFDTAFTMIRRARRGENLLAAHRSHLYQRLTLCGWSHRRTTTLYAALAAVGAATAVGTTVAGLETPLPGVAVIVAGSVLLWSLVVRQEARSGHA